MVVMYNADIVLTSNFPAVIKRANRLDPATLHLSPILTKLVSWLILIPSRPKTRQRYYMFTCLHVHIPDNSNVSWYKLLGGTRGGMSLTASAIAL